MKNLIRLVLIINTLLFCQNLYGMEAANGNCEKGGVKVVVGGLQSTNNVQASYPTCNVTVYITGTITKPVIYSDNATSPTPLANPFPANSAGHWIFYAPNGTYDIVLSGGTPSPGITPALTISAISLYDPINSDGSVDCFAPRFGTSSDIGVRLNACFAFMPATGGTASLGGFRGSWTTATMATTDKPVAVTINVGTTYNYTGAAAAFFTEADGSSIQCQSRNNSKVVTTHVDADAVIFGGNHSFTEGCWFDGPVSTSGSGIELGGNIGNRVSNSRITDFYHCINSGGSGVDNIVEDNIISGCVADGVLFAGGGTGMRATNNSISDTKSNCLDFGGSTGYAGGNVLTNCGDGTYTNDGHALVLYTANTNLSGVVFEGNIIRGSYDCGITVKAQVTYTIKNFVIANNTVAASEGTGNICIDGSGGVGTQGTITQGLIRGNISTDSPNNPASSSAGILINQQDGTQSKIRIESNIDMDSGYNGIWITGNGVGFEVVNNTVLGSANTPIVVGTGALVFCNRTSTSVNYCPISSGFFSSNVSQEITFISPGNTNLRWKSTNAPDGDFSWLLDQFGKFIAFNNDTAASSIEINSGDNVNFPVSLSIGGGGSITKHLSSSASLDFAAWGGTDCQDLTITVTGAADGNTVVLGVAATLAATAGVQFTGRVSSANTISVRGCKITAGASANPAAAIVRADVWQH